MAAAALYTLTGAAFVTEVASAMAEMREATLEHGDEQHATAAMAEARAFVVRTMSKAERSSDAGKAALQLELDKLAEYGCLRPPVSRGTITDSRATLSSLAMLASMKHVELRPHMWKHKGRAVVLGNRIVPARGTVDPSGGGEEAWSWSNLVSDLAALEDGRLVDAWALVHGFSRRSVDFENGYLQCPWPKAMPLHYLVIFFPAFFLDLSFIQPKPTL